MYSKKDSRSSHNNLFNKPFSASLCIKPLPSKIFWKLISKIAQCIVVCINHSFNTFIPLYFRNTSTVLPASRTWEGEKQWKAAVHVAPYSMKVTAVLLKNAQVCPERLVESPGAFRAKQF